MALLRSIRIERSDDWGGGMEASLSFFAFARRRPEAAAAYNRDANEQYRAVSHTV